MTWASSAGNSNQMQALMQASLALTTEPSLERVLQRIAEGARDALRARYAALEVIDERGTGLSQFLTAGAAHPQSGGGPASQPPMESFLGVPIMVRDKAYGNLYVTEKQGGGEFSEADEQVALMLASQAAIAIEHAQAFRAPSLPTCP